MTAVEFQEWKGHLKHLIVYWWKYTFERDLRRNRRRELSISTKRAGKQLLRKVEEIGEIAIGSGTSSNDYGVRLLQGAQTALLRTTHWNSSLYLAGFLGSKRGQAEKFLFEIVRGFHKAGGKNDAATNAMVDFVAPPEEFKTWSTSDSPYVCVVGELWTHLRKCLGENVEYAFPCFNRYDPDRILSRLKEDNLRALLVSHLGSQIAENSDLLIAAKKITLLRLETFNGPIESMHDRFELWHQIRNEVGMPL
jgi:hypothetical protein